MKILILNLPRIAKNLSVTRVNRCEKIFKNRVDTPSNLLILASQLRNLGHNISFIDANGLNLTYKYIEHHLSQNSYECIIFAFNSLIINHELIICKLVKKINPKSITIGFSWYLRNSAHEILKYFKYLDIQIIDNPVFVIEELIQIIESKGNLEKIEGIAYRDEIQEIKINPHKFNTLSFDQLPIPAYDLLESFKPYHIISPLMNPYALVYTGEGCPYGCTYCTVANTKYNGKSVDKILEELRYLKKIAKIRYVWFYDEVFTINRNRSIDLFNEMIRENLKIKWFCDTRADLVDQELLELMRKAGCIGIAYGIESGSQKILDTMNKGITIKQIKQSLKLTRKINIPYQMNLILGYPGETLETLQETEKLIKNNNPDLLQINLIEPLSGTKFFVLAKEKNWLINGAFSNKFPQKCFLNPENYKPFQLDLIKFFKKFHRIHKFNPKWLLNTARSLIKNPDLFLPAIGCFHDMMSRHDGLLKNIIS